ncbi:MAG: 30S ribosomal protein S9 [Patescibacteria group bacterium]|nr:30S ribosomal protein S9 [Patescibacteria group bacterium]
MATIENKKPTAKAPAKAKPAKANAGKFTAVVGKRKRAAAQIRLFQTGSGKIIVNDKEAKTYYSESEFNLIVTPLKEAGVEETTDVSVKITGGGKKGQAEAIRHGIAKALVEINPELRPVMRAKGWLTRDARIKERKKPGLRKARRAPQWSKR